MAMPRVGAESGGPIAADARPGSSLAHGSNLIPMRPAVRPSISALDIPGDCMPVTAADGRRAYCGLTAAAAEPARLVPAAAAASGLLSRPVSELLLEVEAARKARALQEESEAAPGPSSSGSGAAGTRGPTREKLLWVDKYAPRSFMDLLSDELINRCRCGAACSHACMHAWLRMRCRASGARPPCSRHADPSWGPWCELGTAPAPGLAIGPPPAECGNENR